MAGTVSPDVFICPRRVFSRMALYTDGVCQKVEAIYFSRQAFAVHKTHGHLLQGIANGRGKKGAVDWSVKSQEEWWSVWCANLLY